LSPSDARKFFNDLQFIENCPVLWCKIEPLIIAWEKEIAKRSKETCEVAYEDICLNNVKNEISNIKLTYHDTEIEQNTPIEKNNLNLEIDANVLKQNSYLEESLTLNDIIITTENNLEETLNFQEQIQFENDSNIEYDSILGKRILIDENTTIEENKLTKI
jgi:hypothetical protein